MKHLFAMILILGVLTACQKKQEQNNSSSSDEIAQNVGDVMAGIDESGGSSGTLGFYQEVESAKKMYAKLAPLENIIGSTNQIVSSSVMSRAEAASCWGSGFSACSSNVITRTFGGCNVGSFTFNGTVLVTWGGASVACALTSTSDTITRVPAFSVTGPLGGTFSVSKTGAVGQRLTWSSGSGASKVFTFSNDGIRRTFTSASGTLMYDYTTTTTAGITVTGTSRTGRVLNGGSLKITNNLNSNTCTISPSNLSWSSTCTCPTSGSWTGTCSNGDNFTLSVTGCGSGSLSLGGTTTGVSFDRCAGS